MFKNLSVLKFALRSLVKITNKSLKVTFIVYPTFFLPSRTLLEAFHERIGTGTLNG